MREWKSLPEVAAALFGALLLVSCSTAPSLTGGEDTPLGIPNFSVTAYQKAEELGGEEQTVADILDHAGKPLVLNFWAALCPPCRAEMPDLQRAYEERPDVLLLGIDVGPFTFLGSRDEGRALLAELGVEYPAGTMFDSQAFQELQVLGMPTTFFLTPEGILHRKWSGFLTLEKMRELIDDLLAASGISLEGHGSAPAPAVVASTGTTSFNLGDTCAFSGGHSPTE